MYYVIIGASNISIEIMSWLMQSGAEVTILEKNIRWAGKYVKLAKIHKEHQSI